MYFSHRILQTKQSLEKGNWCAIIVNDVRSGRFSIYRKLMRTYFEKQIIQFDNTYTGFKVIDFLDGVWKYIKKSLLVLRFSTLIFWKQKVICGPIFILVKSLLIKYENQLFIFVFLHKCKWKIRYLAWVFLHLVEKYINQ